MPRKILLADDSVTIQKVVELTFSEGDYQVTCVSNGKMAVDQLDANRPDLIICDIIMPEMSGYDVAELVKKNPKYQAIPVILLTGTFEPFDEERARKSGAEAYVTKPFDSKMLVDKVESLLAQKVQYTPVDTVPPATMFMGGSEYQLPGIVTDEAVKKMDAEMSPAPPAAVPQESYDFPNVPQIGEMPAVAPPPPEMPSFEAPVVEDLAIPAEKGEPSDLKGFDAIMEPPVSEEPPQSVLEATASSVPPAPGFATEIPAEAPAWQEPELPETPYAAEAQVPEIAVEAPAEGQNIESFGHDLVRSDVADVSFAPETPVSSEASIPELPEESAPESEITVGEPEPPGEPAAEAGQEVGEVPEVGHEAPAFYEPPVFEAPPSLVTEEAEAAGVEAPRSFMDIPEPGAPSHVVIPPEPSLLVTDMNEQAMMVGEGQKKLDEEKAAMPAEEDVEEAQEYAVQSMAEPEPEEPESANPRAEEHEAQPAAALVESGPAVEAASEAAAELRVSPEMLEEIVRKVIAEMAPGILTNIAWEVIPELANSIIKKRIEELEKEAE